MLPYCCKLCAHLLTMRDSSAPLGHPTWHRVPTFQLGNQAHSPQIPFFSNYRHQQSKPRLTKYSACQFVFMYVGSSACGWGYKYAPKLMQTFYQESNSSDVLAHSLVVSESHFLNIPCPIHGGNTDVWLPAPGISLTSVDKRWKARGQAALFILPRFLPIVQNHPADKARAFLVGKTCGGCRHGMMNSSHSSRLLGAAWAPLRKTGHNSPQPGEEGPAPRQTTPSPRHWLCLFAVTQWGRNPGPQEVSRPLGSWVPRWGSPGEDARRASCFSSTTAKEREKKRGLPGL